MWTLSRIKFINFLNQFLKRTHLTAKRILHLYSYFLFFIPIFFAMLLSFKGMIEKSNFVKIIEAPVISISVIIAFIDFIFGYYLWLNQDKILLKRSSYKFFMLIQFFSQILVGNIICVFFAAIGIYQAKEVKVIGTDSTQDKIIKIASVITAIIFTLCFGLLIILKIGK